MNISDIKIKGRHRVEMGDIDSLAQSIEKLGLLHPVVVTRDNRLICGARRIEAFKKLGRADIPSRVVSNIGELTSVLDAERDENTCRKDFIPSEFVALGEEIEALERKAARERQGDRTDKHPGNFPESSHGRARDLVGIAVGVSGRTYEKAKRVVDAARKDPDRYGTLLAQMDASRNVDRAYKRLKREEKRTQLAQTSHELPSGKYRVFYADPPWKYNDSGLDEYGHAEAHYPTMSVEELCGLGNDIREMSEDDAVLFLWVTSPMLENSFKIISAWGFKYKTSFVWDKVIHNFGHYNSVRHEFLLVCTRGSCTPDTDVKIDSVQTIGRDGDHSEKPERFRSIIQTLYPYGERIELFARSNHDNWNAWGNEVP